MAGIIINGSGDEQKKATGRVHRRDHSRRAGVYWADRAARAIITVGGIGTIIVVLLVVLVLLGNVLPLFRGSALTLRDSVTLGPAEQDSKTLDPGENPASNHFLAFGSDEYSELIWLVRPDQSLDVYSLAEGKHLQRILAPDNPQESKSVRAVLAKMDDSSSSVLLGLESGAVRPILFTIDVSFTSKTELDQELNEAIEVSVGMPVLRDQTVYRSMSSGLIRKVRFAGAEYLDPIPTHSKPIEKLDWVFKADASLMASSQNGIWASTSTDELAVGRYERQAGGLGKPKQSIDVSRTTLSSQIEGLMISGLGDSIHCIDSQGTVSRWVPENESLKRIENYQTLTGQLSSLSALEPLLGRSTILLGNQGGEVEAVSLTTSDAGRELRTIHRVPCSDAAIRSISASPTQRVIAVADKMGGVKLVHVTSERTIAQIDSLELNQNDQLRFSKSGRELLVCNNSSVRRLDVDCEYPEASLASFFRPLWYEGYHEPNYVWQSSTGSSEGEPKFSLIPLVFGTLKATFYSMLIAAPIAILAAIFGSEFLTNSWRVRFKPLIELMASVPSVVLGFIGAMVLAPIMRDSLFWILLSVAMTLFLFLLCAHLWILIPPQRSIPLRKYRLPLMFIVPPLAIILSGWLATPLERWLFGSTMQAWLSDPQMSGWPGWFLLMILPTILGVLWLISGPLANTLEGLSTRMGLQGTALWQTVLFLSGCLVVLCLSGLGASLWTGLEFDARRGLLGTYQERNALLVGSILGFAIIPLIYTLADDALQSVPQHLRSASLGCGATVWQTTIRVVVPTAMSGLFSALMIGFGRAIGETMVVLMAAGNTPLIDWNPFNGYRTLSATLATELPEAARGSTHYHTLFLAALLLFLFTLVANTIAEWVRMKFRKRAYQL